MAEQASAERWKDGLIQTGIDKLMEYLRKERQVSIEEAADSLGVDTGVVIKWAKSLQDNGLVEIRYTARRGRVLRLIEDGDQDAIEQAREDVSDRMKALSNLEQEMARLSRFEDVLHRMEDRLEDDEESAKDLQELHDDIEELQQYIDDLETVEQDLHAVEEHIEEVKQDMTSLSAIQELHEQETVDADKGTAEGNTDSKNPLKKVANAVSSHLPGFGGSTETYTCDECGREFDTRRGLRTHQGMIHKN